MICVSPLRRNLCAETLGDRQPQPLQALAACFSCSVFRMRRFSEGRLWASGPGGGSLESSVCQSNTSGDFGALAFVFDFSGANLLDARPPYSEWKQVLALKETDIDNDNS